MKFKLAGKIICIFLLLVCVSFVLFLVLTPDNNARNPNDIYASGKEEVARVTGMLLEDIASPEISDILSALHEQAYLKDAQLLSVNLSVQYTDQIMFIRNARFFYSLEDKKQFPSLVQVSFYNERNNWSVLREYPRYKSKKEIALFKSSLVTNYGNPLQISISNDLVIDALMKEGYYEVSIQNDTTEVLESKSERR